MKKRVLSMFIAAMLLVTLMVPAFTASAMIGPQYVKTSNGKALNMRFGPSKDFDIVIKIPYGAQVSSYEYYDNNWAYVTYNGYSGYAMSRYFSSTKPSKVTPQPTAKPADGTTLFKSFTAVNYYVTVRPSTPTGYVNMRWAPSKTMPIKGTYRADALLHVISENGTWAQVYDENTNTCGFMMLSFLSPVLQ